MIEINTLYKITNGIGTYWVVATDPTAACNKLKDMLDKADYGFYNKRKPTEIVVVSEQAREGYLTDKFLIL